MKLKQENKQKFGKIYLLIFFITLIIAIVQFYFLNELTKSFDNKLNLFQQDIDKKLEDMQSELYSKVSKIESDARTQISNLSQSVESIKQESKENINSLTEKIGEVEKESSKKLSNLENKIDSGTIQSGDLTGIVERSLKATVSVLTNSGQGSGAIIDKRGFIVTNYHVVADTRKIKVMTYDSKLRDAKVIGYNYYKDVVLLKIEGSDFDFLEYGDSSNLAAGQKVIALGNPGGLDFTVTEGIISNPDREPKKDLHFVQIDVPINPGNSGGPLVNTDGKLIGIINYKLTGFESLGFALHSDIVKETTDDLIIKYYEATNQ